MLLLNSLLALALERVHPCARYIEVDLPVLAIALLVLIVAANILYAATNWLLVRSSSYSVGRERFVSLVLHACVAWLMLNGFLVNDLPMLINNPEVLCD